MIDTSHSTIQKDPLGGLVVEDVQYTDADVASANVTESTLGLFAFDGTWSAVPGSTVDTGANVVSANVTEFGDLAPLGQVAPDGTGGDGENSGTENESGDN